MAKRTRHTRIRFGFISRLLGVVPTCCFLSVRTSIPLCSSRPQFASETIYMRVFRAAVFAPKLASLSLFFLPFFRSVCLFSNAIHHRHYKWTLTPLDSLQSPYYRVLFCRFLIDIVSRRGLFFFFFALNVCYVSTSVHLAYFCDNELSCAAAFFIMLRLYRFLTLLYLPRGCSLSSFFSSCR